MQQNSIWKLLLILGLISLFFGCQIHEEYTFVYINHTQHQITITFHRVEGHEDEYTLAPESSIHANDYQLTNAPDQKAVIVFDDQKMSVHINHRDEERDCSMYNSLYCFDSYKVSEKLKLVAYDIRQRDYDEAAEIQRD